MVAKSLAALDQTEVPDQAVVAAAHSSQSAVLESLHREMDAPLSDPVNSRWGFVNRSQYVDQLAVLVDGPNTLPRAEYGDALHPV
jgi:hypothetical protein